MLPEPLAGDTAERGVLRSVELAVIRVAQENGRVAAFPDPHSLARDELTSLLQDLTSREEVVSDERRVLHAQIDALRRELVDRLRDEGNMVISGSDFLDPGSAGVREPRNPGPQNVSDCQSHPPPTLGQTRHHRAIRRVGRSAEVASAESPRGLRRPGCSSATRVARRRSRERRICGR